MESPLNLTLRESLSSNGFEQIRECAFFMNADGSKDRYIVFHNDAKDETFKFLESILDKVIADQT